MFDSKVYGSPKIQMLVSVYVENDMAVLKRMCFPLISNFGGLSQLDYDDFYSIANYTLYQAAQSYDEIQNDNFNAYLMNCINNKFKTEMTRRNRERRIPASKTSSLDCPLNNDTDVTFGESLDGGFDINNEINELADDDGVSAYIDSLSPKQKKIAALIIDGYSIPEIKEILHITDEKMSMMLSRMRSFEKRMLLKH